MKTAKDPAKSVRLRVAGIFYDQLINISHMVNPTIESVMREAQETTPLTYGFEFRKVGGMTYQSMIKISHMLPATITSLGGKRRGPGTYALSEMQIPNGVIAWQYYLIDASGRSRSANPVGAIVSPAAPGIPGGFSEYDRTQVVAGDTIIWRMVAICTTPS